MRDFVVNAGIRIAVVGGLIVAGVVYLRLGRLRYAEYSQGTRCRDCGLAGEHHGECGRTGIGQV